MNRNFFSAICAVALCGGADAQSFIQNPANGHYYAAVLAPGISWNDAKAQAEATSFAGSFGYLVTITSEAENNFVADNFFPTFRDFVSPLTWANQAWAGGYQNPINTTQTTSGWTWVNGEGTFPGVDGDLGAFDNAFSKWHAGEPNDNTGPASEQYLSLFIATLSPATVSATVWNDSTTPTPWAGKDTAIAGYIVEVTPVPEPSEYAAVSALICAGTAIWLRRRK